MKKRKRLYPRRARALRRAALALAMLLFCNFVLHIGLPLPIQALRYAEQSEGVYERTRVVMKRWEPGMMHLIDALYLAEGENTLSLFCASPGVYGWMGGFVWPVDTTDGGDVQAGAVNMSRDGREDAVVFYGRVKGTEAVDLTADVLSEEWTDAEDGPRSYVYEYEIGEEDRRVRDGYTYFIFVEPDPVPEEKQRFPRAYRILVNRGEERIAYDFGPTASVYWG